jgi:hypothetical protein
MASTVIGRDFVSMIAEEMALGVETAVECWIAQIECALSDVHLTRMERLKAVKDVVDKYKQLTGKGDLTSQAS